MRNFECKGCFMRQYFLLALLVLIMPLGLAVFDKTRTENCLFTITCPDGYTTNFHDLYDVCEEGWGFCFTSEACGDDLIVSQICGDHVGGGGGGGGGGDQCLFDPFHCNPFAT